MRYLEKEIKQRDSVIQELIQKPFQYPSYSSPVTQSKHALEALQRTYETNLVINLKQVIQDQKAELLTKEKIIENLKHDSKGTLLREVRAERNAFEDEAIRLRGILDNFIMQIGGVDQILNFRGFIDQQQEYIKQLENQKETQQKLFDDKYNECLELEKKLLETEVEREEARKETKDKIAIIEGKDRDIEQHIREYKYLERKKQEAEDDYTAKIKSIEKILATRESTIEKLTNTLSDRDKTIQNNKQEIAKLNSTVTKLKEDIENRDGIIAERDYTIEERDGKIEELEQFIKDKQAEFDAFAKRKKEEFDSTVKRMTQERQDSENNLNGQIDGLEKEIVKMVEEKNKLIQAHEKRCAEYDDDIEELQNKLKALQLEKEKVMENLKSTERKMQDDKEQYEGKIR